MCRLLCSLCSQMPLKGVRAAPVGQDRGYFVIYVDRIDPATLAKGDPRIAAFGDQYRTTVDQELQRQMVTAMREDVGVETNDAAVSATKKQLSGDS